jgi:hypothetical protein
MCNCLLSDVKQFTLDYFQSDDICVIGIQRP